MTFEINEYVWDRVWDSAAMVTGLEIEGGETTAYRVAEINEQRKLGRTAYRQPAQLCRYVRVLLPEDEAVACVTREPTPRRLELLANAGDRIIKQLRKRGVEFDAAH